MSETLGDFEKAILDAINQAECDIIEYIAANHYLDDTPYDRTCRMMSDIERILMKRFCPNLIGHPDLKESAPSTGEIGNKEDL